MTLTGQNTYAGGTVIGGGTLSITSDSALGTAPLTPTPNVTFSGTTGALQLFGTSGVTLNANRTIFIASGDTATLDTQGNNVTVGGSVTGPVAGTGALSVSGTGSLNILGSISNVSALQVATAANVTLSQGYTGATNITMTAGVLNSLGSLTSGTTNIALTTATINSLTTSAQTFGTLTLGGTGVISASGNLNFSSITSSSATVRLLTIASNPGQTITVSSANGINQSSVTLAGNVTTTFSTATQVLNSSAAATFSVYNGAKAVFDNTTQNISRDPGATAYGLTLAGGTLDFRASTSAGAGQTLAFGAIGLAAGASTIDLSNDISSTALTISGTTFTRPLGSTLNISFTGSLGTTEQIIATGFTAGLQNGVIFANGVDFATVGSNIVSSFTGYTAVTTGAIAGGVGVVVPNVTGNASITGTVQVADLKINGNGIVIAGFTTPILSFSSNTALGANMGGIISTGGVNDISQVQLAWTSAANQDLTFNVVNTTDGLIVGKLGNTATGSFTKVGFGTMTISGATASMAGTMFVEQGVVAMGTGGTFPLTMSVAIAPGATFSANGANLTVSGLTGGGAVNLGLVANQTFAVGGNNGSSNFTGSFVAGGTPSNNTLFIIGTGTTAFGSTDLSMFGAGINIAAGIGAATFGESATQLAGSFTLGSGIDVTFSGLSGGTVTAATFAPSLTATNSTTINFTQSGSFNFAGGFNSAGITAGGTMLFKGVPFTSGFGTVATFSGGTTPAAGLQSWALGDASLAGLGQGYLFYNAANGALRTLNTATDIATSFSAASSPSVTLTNAATLYGISAAAGNGTVNVTNTSATAQGLYIDLGATTSSAITVAGAGAGASLSLSSGVIEIVGTGTTQGFTLNGFNNGIQTSATAGFGIFVGSNVTATLLSPLVGTGINKSGTGSLTLGVANPNLRGPFMLENGGLLLNVSNALNNSTTITANNGTSIAFANGVSVTLGGIINAGPPAGITATTSTMSVGTGATINLGQLTGSITTNIGATSTLLFGSSGVSSSATGNFTIAANSTAVKQGVGATTIVGTLAGNGTGVFRIDQGTIDFYTRTASSAMTNTTLVINPGGSFNFLTTMTGTMATTLSGNAIVLQGGNFTFRSTAAATPTVGTLSLAAGQSSMTFSQSGTLSASTLTFTTLSRSNHASLLVNTSAGSLGGGPSGLQTTNILFPSISAGAGLNQTYQTSATNGNQGVFPYLMIDQGAGSYMFATYDTTTGVGLRAATASGETITSLATANSSGPYSNVIIGGGTSTVMTGGQTLNALIISNSAPIVNSLDLAGNLLTINGGLLASSGVAASISSSLAGGAITFGPGNTVGSNFEGNIFTGTALSISASIADAASPVTIVKSGVSTLFLSGANTYSGGMQINSGTVNIVADNNLGASSGTLTFSGTGALQIGAANVTLNAGRTLFIANNGTTTATTGAFIDGTTNGVNIASSIQGTGNLILTASAAAAVTLSGNNTFGGAGNYTVLESGTFQLASANALGNSANTILTTTGTPTIVPQVSNMTITNNLTLSTATTIIGDSGNGFGLTLSGTILNSSGSRTLTINNPSGVNLSGTILLSEINTTARTLTISGTGSVNITASILDASVGLGSTLALNPTASTSVFSYSGTFGTAGAVLALSPAAAGTITLGTGSYVDLSSYAQSLLTLTAAGTIAINTTSSTPFGNTVVNVAGGTFSLTPTVAGANISENITLASGLTIGTNAAGGLTLSGTITASGAARTITSNNTTGLSLTGTLALSEGAAARSLILTGAQPITVSGAITDPGAFGSSLSLNVTGTGTYTFSPTSIANTAIISLNPVAGASISVNMSGTTGTPVVTLTNSGNIVLGAASNVFGNAAVNIGGGTPVLVPTLANTVVSKNITLGSNLIVADNTGNANGLTLSGTITNSGNNRTLTNSNTTGLWITNTLDLAESSSARTLTFAGSGNTTVSAVIQNGGAGTGSIALAVGSGTLLLTNANTFNGTATISGGIARLGNALALQNATVSIGAGAVAFNGGIGSFTFGGLSGGGALSLTDLASNAVTLYVGNNNGNGAYTGSLGTAGTFVKVGSGTETLSGNAATFSGGVAVQAGTLYFQSPQTGPAVTGNIAVSSGSTFVVDTTGNNITLTNLITGSGGLEKAGFGTLYAPSGSSYAGGTTIAGGLLAIAADSALGATGAGTGITFSAATAISNNGGLQFTANGITTDPSRALTANSGFQAVFDTNGNNATIGGALNGAGDAIKFGNGTLRLGVAGGLTGTVTISSGNLLLGDAQALQSATVSVGAANGLSFAATIGTFTVGGLSGMGAVQLVDTGAAAVALNVGGNNASSSFGGALGGIGSLTKVGSGTLTLSGTSSTYSGGTTINGGTLAVVGNGTNYPSLGATPGSPTTNITFSGNSALLFATSGTLSANRAITVNSGFTGTLDTSTNVVTIAGGIGGLGGINKAGLGTLSLIGTNTYSGGTTISAGAIAIGADAALGASAGTVTFAGGSLQFSGTGLTIGTGRAFNALSGQAANFDTSAVAGSTDTVNGVISGAGGLLKNTAGTLVLTQANQYTGTTTVSAGTLALQFSGTTLSNIINSSSALALRGGTLSLVGSGTNAQTFNGTSYAAGSSTIAYTAATGMTLTLAR